jgi:hypothetical protein
MKEYTVIQGLGLDELILRVNESIKQGWQPIGGIDSIAIPDPTGKGLFLSFRQAMVK